MSTSGQSSHNNRSLNNTRSNETHSFETYRQMAPEIFDDDSLRSLIRTNNNDHNAIVGAIENIWHGMCVMYNITHFSSIINKLLFFFPLDIPDQKAVGQDWVTTGTSKPRKVSDALVKNSLSENELLLYNMISYP